MLKFNTGQQRGPIGGHQFPDHGIMFRADTYEALVTKLKEFRVMNGIAIGNPEQEILLHYAKNWPWMVRHDRDAVPTEQNPDYIAWRDWVGETWRRPPTKLLTVKEAKLRWDVCKSCPFNRERDWRETTESAEFTRRAFLLRRGLDIPAYLGFCALHRCDIGVFSFIDAPREFSAKEAGKTHIACWAFEGPNGGGIT